MQQPPSDQNWSQQGQEQYGYGQPSQPFSPDAQWGQMLYAPQQDQWQQPYGQPFPNWQPTPPRRSRKGLWIVLGIVAALLVFGCLGVSVLISQASKSVNTAVNNAQATVTGAQATINAAETQVPTSAPTTAPTQASTQPASSGNWKTVQTFTGNGTEKTPVFSVPGDWKIVYSCNGIIAGVAASGILVVSLYDSTGNPIDPAAVNATCKSGSELTTGQTEEHQSGKVYLNVNGTGDWTVQIQEPK